MNENWQKNWKDNVEKTVEQLTKGSPFAEMGQNAKTFFTSALQKLDVSRATADIWTTAISSTRAGTTCRNA